MRSFVLASLSSFLLLVLAGCASDPAEPGAGAQNQPTEKSAPAARRFEITYTTTLSDLPQGAPLKLWIPVPALSAHQTIGEVKVDLGGSKLSHRFTVDPIWGNRTLFVEGACAEPTATLTVSYSVERRERGLDLTSLPSETLDAKERARGLSPGRLVVIDERIRGEATALVGETDLARAQAAYDHVALQMVYDKSGEGWGRGDSLYACEVGKGNCTDYHAYFMALCAARKIPTRFEIGLFGPYEPQPGKTIKLGGYHCWAEFWAGTWVPVDISEGDKKEQSFLGVQTPNRVTLSRGRDLVLEPAQAGEPLNYMVNPYAEVSGKTHPGVGKAATWRELD